MPTFYYADAAQKPVGPVTLDVLRTLRSGGTIADDTLINEIGTPAWCTYGSYQPPPAPLPGARAADAHERAAASAAQASAKAEAVAMVVKHSFLSTVQAAKSFGERLTLFGAFAGLLAFLLPWASGLGGSANGWSLASNASGLLFLLPLSLLGMCFLSYLNIKATRRERLLRARWFVFTGAFWGGISMLGLVVGRGFFGAASIGLYLTFLATAAIAVGGILQTGDHVRTLAD